MRRKRQPNAGDITNLALICKVLGVLILLPSALFAALDTLWAFIGVGIGLLFLVLGVGLRRFRPWAWYLGVVVLVPLYVAGGVAGLILIGAGVVTVMSVAMLLSAFHVSWVLLSKGGRQRYVKIREALDRADAEPGTLVGRYYGKKSRRTGRSAQPPDRTGAAGDSEGREG